MSEILYEDEFFFIQIPSPHLKLEQKHSESADLHQAIHFPHKLWMTPVAYNAYRQ